MGHRDYKRKQKQKSISSVLVSLIEAIDGKCRDALIAVCRVTAASVAHAAIAQNVNNIEDVYSKVCSRKRTTYAYEKKWTVRTAVDRVVEEREIARSELDVDLHSFLDEHEYAVNQRR